MDEAAKKTALRMIPYGLFVMTVKDDKTMTGAAVNWLTQASFAPPPPLSLHTRSRDWDAQTCPT